MTQQTFICSSLQPLVTCFLLVLGISAKSCHSWELSRFQYKFEGILSLSKHLRIPTWDHLTRLSISEHYPLKKHFVGFWLDTLIGSEKVTAPTLFPGLKCLAGKEKTLVWETNESSTMKEWRAPLLGQLPTAETGYDTLNLTVECMTMAAVSVRFSPQMYVSFPPHINGKKWGCFNFTKPAITVWVFKDIANFSHTHLPPLFRLWPTYIITWAHSHLCVCVRAHACLAQT